MSPIRLPPCVTYMFSEAGEAPYMNRAGVITHRVILGKHCTTQHNTRRIQTRGSAPGSEGHSTSRQKVLICHNKEAPLHCLVLILGAGGTILYYYTRNILVVVYTVAECLYSAVQWYG